MTMKKIFMMMATVALTLSVCACGGGSKTADNGSGAAAAGSENAGSAATEQTETEGQNAASAKLPVVYNNAKFGFSVGLPEGFHPQNNDAQMEEERGGKVYVGNGSCMVDMQCEDKSADVNTPAAMVKSAIEFAAHDNDKVIEKQILGDHGYILWTDDMGNRGLFYKAGPDKKFYTISVTYAADKVKEFNEQVKEIFNSLKTK